MFPSRKRWAAARRRPPPPGGPPSDDAAAYPQPPPTVAMVDWDRARVFMFRETRMRQCWSCELACVRPRHMAHAVEMSCS